MSPSRAGMPPGGIVRCTVSIGNKRGLHARAAAQFVKVAGKFDAEITVHKDGTAVSGRSIMGLMMLAAGLGCDIELTAQGRQSVEALDALAQLVTRNFEED